MNKQIKNNVIELVGNTPLLNISGINKNVYIKLENKNPGGSIKDRAVLGMIIGMEERGELQLGDTLIEATSGNTGIAVSMVGRNRGYKVKIVMPESMSKERRAMIKAYGAELILTEASKGMKGSIDKMNELIEEKGYKSLKQFENPDNPKYHYNTTGPEILRDLEDVDIFVAGIGTGGTVSGVGKYLKENKKDVLVVGVEPASSPLLTEGSAGPHKIQGLGANFIPKNYDADVVDEVITIKDEEAFELVRQVADKEGVLIGISGGANIAAALKLSAKYPDKKIVTVVPDGAEKYMSMDIL